MLLRVSREGGFRDTGLVEDSLLLAYLLCGPDSSACSLPGPFSLPLLHPIHSPPLVVGLVSPFIFTLPHFHFPTSRVFSKGLLPGLWPWEVLSHVFMTSPNKRIDCRD